MKSRNSCMQPFTSRDVFLIYSIVYLFTTFTVRQLQEFMTQFSSLVSCERQIDFKYHFCTQELFISCLILFSFYLLLFNDPSLQEQLIVTIYFKTYFCYVGSVMFLFVNRFFLFIATNSCRFLFSHSLHVT